MNIDIKFRAWDGFNKKMTYWAMNDLCTWDAKDEKPSAIEDWMQFTGLKDKNGKGKEVYQSDLIRVCPGGYEPREIYEVVWDEERLCWGIKSKIGLITSLWTFEKDFEVIGNSYENKELLK